MRRTWEATSEREGCAATQVLGQGQPFQGFGSKINEPLRFLREALAEGTLQGGDWVVFTDAFDTFFGASAASFAAAAAAVPAGVVLFSVRAPRREGEREREREWTWWAHTGGGNALAFKPPT
jgi:hypothetical protein